RSAMDPQDRRYTKEHEWVLLEGDRARVGITDYAQKQLGDVVFLELPKVGRKLKAHEVFGTVESVKAVSELFAPLSGEVGRGPPPQSREDQQRPLRRRLDDGRKALRSGRGRRSARRRRLSRLRRE